MVTRLAFYAKIGYNNMNTHLFQKIDFVSHSGLNLDFKLECDALTNDDWETLAYIISKKVKFYDVFGVPRGGLVLAEKLKKYRTKDLNLPLLVVDDILTTGRSMEEMKKHCNDTECMGGYIGVVVFARAKCPEWITPMFQMWN